MKNFIQAFKVSNGRPVGGPDWRDEVPPELLGRLKAAAELSAGEPVAMFVGDGGGVAQPECLLATIVNGEVTGVAVDPAWQPPAPPPDPLAELVAKVDKLPAGTIHETRLRDQKEFLKLWAIPWVKANPQATPEDAAQAILAALRAEFPADPICIGVYAKDPDTGREDGLLMSYAESAHLAGLTPDKSWQALRDLIVNTPEQQLREALRKL